MKIAVTGGAGFIGSRLAKYLVAAGHDVLVIDNLSTADGSLIPEGASRLFLDIADFAMYEALRGVELIAHLATTNITLAEIEPMRAIRTNVAGMQRVLDAARFTGAGVVYTGSVSIYGRSDVQPITEDTRTNPRGIYASTKLTGDHLAARGGAVTVRLSNVYGPHQLETNPYCGVVSNFMRKPDPVIYGDGTDTRDYLFIDDVVDALVIALYRSQRLRGVMMNLGTGIETSVNDLARLMGVTPRHEKPRGIDGIPRRVIDSTMARTLLGWRPKTDLQHGLELTQEWFKHEYPMIGGHKWTR